MARALINIQMAIALQAGSKTGKETDKAHVFIFRETNMLASGRMIYLMGKVPTIFRIAA